MVSSKTSSLVSLFALLTGALAQSTAPQYGQCGGIGWTGATTCPAGWTCTKNGDYYSQCLPGASSPTTTSAAGGGGSSPTTTGSSPGATPTLINGWAFIRAVEDPNFHKYLQSRNSQTVGDAILGSTSTAALFQVTGGNLIQRTDNGSVLYGTIEPRANSTVVKLKMSWNTKAPTDGGAFSFSGDELQWSIPTITRPNIGAWLACPDSTGAVVVYANLGAYGYQTPAGCADETIHSYTGPYPNP